jgi:beta-1,4-N-acetylglucosaminyltransferase
MFLLAAAFGFMLLFRLVLVLKSIQRHRDAVDRPHRTNLPIKTLAVLGSGGHTTEMLQMLKNIDPNVYDPLIYVIASTDDTSERRVKAFGGRLPSETHYIPRSREVGQSYLTSVVSTLWAFAFSIWLVAKIRPEVLICNGPGTCLPVAVATLLFRVLGVCEGNLVFIESFCRVETLSLTGKLLYPVADMFVVHWDELHSKYPRSKTISTFVPNKSKAI